MAAAILPPLKPSEEMPRSSKCTETYSDQDSNKLPNIYNNGLGYGEIRRRNINATSPFKLPIDDPMKFFIPGYQGYIPGHRFLAGSSFSRLSHQALNRFSMLRDLSEQNRFDQNNLYSNRSLSENYQIDSVATKTQPKPIYPKTSGLIPNYSGHIPGHKFRCGKTFGDITVNVRNLNGTPATVS